MARDGHKLHVTWIGPLPVVFVVHPEAYKQLIAQTSDKGVERFDPFRMLMPWIGELRSLKLLHNLFRNILFYVTFLCFVNRTSSNSNPILGGTKASS